MALKNVVPFLNYRVCDDKPALLNLIVLEIQELGLKIHHTDVQSIAELQSAAILHTRVPVILHATHAKEKDIISPYLLQMLKSKFLTAITIEGDAEELPALIAAQRHILNMRNNGSESELVKEIRKIVYFEMHNPDLSLAFISKKLQISRQALQKAFHNAGFSQGVWEYVLELRMQEAVRVIRESNLPLKEISAILGYREYDSFSKIFKKVLGYSPKEAPRSA